MIVNMKPPVVEYVTYPSGVTARLDELGEVTDLYIPGWIYRQRRERIRRMHSDYSRRTRGRRSRG